MLKEERQERLIAYLMKKKIVKTSLLSRKFEVSEVTIRKDLKELAENNIFDRIHGGAMLSRNTDLPYNIRESSYKKEKELIAKKALEFIEAGEVIFLDAGTTTYQITLAIKKQELFPLSVATNSLQIAYELSQTKVNLKIIGGDLRKETLSMIGRDAENQLENLRVNKLFLGSSGINVEYGITNTNIFEAELKQKMIKIAKEIILVADSSKLDRVALNKVVDIDMIDILITDEKADKEFIDKAKKYIQIIIATDDQ